MLCSFQGVHSVKSPDVVGRFKAFANHLSQKLPQLFELFIVLTLKTKFAENHYFVLQVCISV